MGTELKIYTDGGCSGNPGPGGWAYVITKSLQIITEKWGAEKNTTNNRMELSAVIAALEALPSLSPSPGKVTVYTDSQYVQKGITQWIRAWKQNNWLTSGKKPVKNQDLWQRLDTLSGGFSLAWVWVKGHAGDELNERCDQMTQEAIASIQ
ncbi:MAG: ribonuclease HI [Treponema sp.]|jgi:ribonuclease HI|nr:ribonuclease HI [Treponema sp.]